MKKIVYLILTCILFAGQLFAQNRTVTGKVTDASGNEIPGASIMIKGSSSGTTTQTDGSFTISVPANAKTLVFSAVGLANEEVSIGNASVINTVLRVKSNDLQEVVVTSLGISRDKRSLGYATQTIKSDQIANKGEPNLLNALQGKVAGVNITGSSGGAGASTNINIRGITSFNGNNQPLFVIDGVPVSNDVDRTNGGPLGTLGDNQPANRALDIDPNNIESVNILKGPAAAVLYGSRASAGAIIITTKKGGSAKGRSEFVFNSSYSIQEATGMAELQNEYGQGLNGTHNPLSSNSWGPRFGTTPSVANGLIQAGVPVDYRPYPNNINDFFETGHMFDNSLSVNGGDLNQNYTFSISNLSQKGIIPNTDFKRTSVRFGANTVLREKFRLGGSVTFVNSLQNGVTQGNGASSLGVLVNIPRSFNLQATRTDYKNADGTNKFFFAGFDNPYFNAYENPLTSNLYRVTGNISLGYDITKWLNVLYRLGIDAYTDRRKQIFAISSNRVPAGQTLDDVFYRGELNGDLIINARKTNMFLEGLDINVLAGQNVNQRKFQNVSLQGDALTIPGYYNSNNATVFTNGSGEENSTRRILGYYGQLSFAYNNYLFMEFTGRADQSSTLPKSKNTYFYPSVNTSFVLTDALKIDSRLLSYAKIRASIAKVGRDADPYLLDNVYVTGSFGNNVANVSFPFILSSGTVSGFGASSRIATNDLSPEFTTSKEIGLNLGLMNNKVSIDLAYFNNKSEDQIVNVGVAPSSGYSSRTTNIGELSNKGFEALVNVTAISTKNFKWDVSANFTQIRTKVISIAPGIKSFPITGNAFTGTVPTIYEGEPYGVIVGSKIPRSPDGQFIIDAATGTFAPGVAGSILADPNPDYTAGMTNTFSYKSFVLSVLVDYTHGGDIVSFTSGFLRARGSLKETAIDREQPRIIPGVIRTGDKFAPNNIQIPAQTYWQAFGLQSDLNVYDASIFRLRELTVGYDLPTILTKKLRVSGIRFAVFARNLFFIAPNSPIDPSVNTQGAGNIRGLEIQSAPNARNIGANLKLSF